MLPSFLRLLTSGLTLKLPPVHPWRQGWKEGSYLNFLLKGISLRQENSRFSSNERIASSNKGWTAVSAVKHSRWAVLSRYPWNHSPWGPLHFLGNYSLLTDTLPLTLEKLGVVMLGTHFIFYFVSSRIESNRLCRGKIPGIFFAWAWTTWIENLGICIC